MDKNENKIFEDVQIFTYVERMVNCQMRFIDIFTPDFTDDSNETGKQQTQRKISFSGGIKDV